MQHDPDCYPVSFYTLQTAFAPGKPSTIEVALRADACLRVKRVHATVLPAMGYVLIHDIRIDDSSILPAAPVDAFHLSAKAKFREENRKLSEPYDIHVGMRIVLTLEYTGLEVVPEFLDRQGMLGFGFMFMGDELDHAGGHEDQTFKGKLEALLEPMRSNADNTETIGYLLAAALELSLRQGHTVDTMIESLQRLPSRFPRTN